jgi:hypothetical protein
MNTTKRLDSEIAAAKLRREIAELEIIEAEARQAERAQEAIFSATPQYLLEFAQPFQAIDWSYQVRFDLPTFSILAKVSKMSSQSKVEWHWTRNTAWHHVNTLDEALVYGAEQGSRWVDVPPPF